MMQPNKTTPRHSGQDDERLRDLLARREIG